MKLVIDIPDAIKEMADEGDKKLIHMMWMLILIDAIKNGIVLPKGHGRLIDGDSLKNCFHYGEANTNNENDMIMAARRIIKSAPTVIEADKEGAE